MRLKWLLAATFVIASAVPVTSAHAADPSPTWTRTTSQWNRSSSPTIADVNGDGVPEIVIGHEDGYVRVLDRNGNALPHWPQPAIMSGSSPTAIDSSPAVADLHKDGTPEIIVGVGSKFQPSPHNGGVIVFRNDGAVQCRFFTRDTFNVPTGGGPDGYADGVYSTPAIGDVNGDGFPDIVFGSWDHYVHAIDRNCHEISGFPFNTEDTIWSSPALYDVDHDGRLEIFIGNDYLGTPAFSGGVFHALDWQNGAVRVLWSRRVTDVIQSSPAIADINGDGRPEVVVGAGNYFNRSDGHRVFAWDLATGANVAGWPVLTGGVTFSSPAVGDLDGNGRPDVVIGSSDGVLQAYRGNGARNWAVHLPFNTGPGHAITASPIIADLNGDGHNDVGVGNDFAFFVVDGRNGSILSRRNTFQSYEAAGAVGNFGSAGWRLVVSGFDTPHHTSTLAAYSIPAPRTSTPWPMFRRTPTHVAAPTSGGHALPPNQCRASSNPLPHESAASANGYWFVDSKGSVYSFGNAKYYGGLPSIRNTSGAAAITASPGGTGYWILSPSGGVFSFGSARFHGSMGGHALNAPIIGMSATRSGRGYWLLGRDGGVFSFGDASFYGSMGGRHLNAPIIAMTPTVSGRGYWLLAADGGVFSFGDASFYGSMGGRHLNAPIIAMTPTVSGRGYWLLAADGGVFSFGDASFYGSTGGRRLNAPVISMAAGPGGVGYWLLARDGGVFSFRVPFYGSVPGIGLCSVPTSRQIRSSSTGRGYWLLATNGLVFHFGDAKNFGSYTRVTSPAIDIAISR